MPSVLERLYAASPVWIQNLGINVYGIYRKRRRLGPEFERLWPEYVERERWDQARMASYVNDRLREQAVRAFREVSYYRQAFSSRGFAEHELSRITVEDLPRLPLLEKLTVRNDPTILLTEASKQSPPSSFSTSGTTGTPIRVFMDRETHSHNMAVREARSFRWAGVSVRDSRSAIGGRVVVPKAESRPPFWRYNASERQLYLSAFHISRDNTREYVRALNQYRPVVMNGYVSAHYFLARFVNELGLKVSPPRAIITESERLEPHMRSEIESAFGAHAFEEYGSVENCGLATECERGRLHVHVDFGVIEILRPDGTPAPPGEVGEIVQTGFANSRQIFIRYRVGDLAAWDPSPCACGRAALPVLRDLIGRQEDTVFGPDGREMVRFHGLFIGLPGVLEGQLIQETEREFEVKLVPTARYSPADGDAIRRRMHERLGAGISVHIVELAEIPREASGKFRAVISRVSRRPANTARS